MMLPKKENDIKPLIIIKMAYFKTKKLINKLNFVSF